MAKERDLRNRRCQTSTEVHDHFVARIPCTISVVVPAAVLNGRTDSMIAVVDS
jgi:hypothetical protein